MRKDKCDKPRVLGPSAGRAWLRSVLVGLGSIWLGFATAAHAQAPRPVTIAVPTGAAAETAGQLAQRFQAQTGREVRVAPLPAPDLARAAQGGPAGADALLVPERLALGQGAPALTRASVFMSDAVIAGSRTDRARVRGQRDIAAAFRWIAGSRALATASSPQLGLRALELSLWDAAGVDIRTRALWYEPGEGDEAAAFARAAATGSYVLIERMTFAAQQNRRGMEVIASGDPRLATRWESLLLVPDPDVRSWHDWLRSEAGQDALGRVQLNGIAPLAPLPNGPANGADRAPGRAADPS